MPNQPAGIEKNIVKKVGTLSLPWKRNGSLVNYFCVTKVMPLSRHVRRELGREQWMHFTDLRYENCDYINYVMKKVPILRSGFLKRQLGSLCQQYISLQGCWTSLALGQSTVASCSSCLDFDQLQCFSAYWSSVSSLQGQHGFYAMTSPLPFVGNANLPILRPHTSSRSLSTHCPLRILSPKVHMRESM